MRERGAARKVRVEMSRRVPEGMEEEQERDARHERRARWCARYYSILARERRRLLIRYCCLARHGFIRRHQTRQVFHRRQPMLTMLALERESLFSMPERHRHTRRHAEKRRDIFDATRSSRGFSPIARFRRFSLSSSRHAPAVYAILMIHVR